MTREDLIRDFLNTLLIPQTQETLFKYVLVPSISETKIQLMFEVPSALLTQVQPLIVQVEEWLKKTFPKFAPVFVSICPGRNELCDKLVKFLIFTQYVT